MKDNRLRLSAMAVVNVDLDAKEVCSEMGKRVSKGFLSFLKLVVKVRHHRNKIVAIKSKTFY
jgi:hypothetical protein